MHHRDRKLKRPITTKETELVIKDFNKQNQSPGTDGFTSKFNQALKEELYTHPFQTLAKLQKEETFPN